MIISFIVVAGTVLRFYLSHESAADGSLSGKGAYMKKAAAESQLEEILAEAQRELSKNSKDKQALVNITGYYLKKREIQKAREYNDRLLLSYPDDYHGLVNTGLIDLFDRSLEKAEKSFRKAAEKDPAGTDALYNLALLALEMSGDKDKAKHFFKKALEADPLHFRSMNRLAAIYFAENKMEDCIALLKKAYEVKNDDPDILNDLGLYYLRTGDYNAAQKYFQRLVELFQDWRGYYNLGIASLQTGFVDLALEHFRKAHELNPDEIHLMNDFVLCLIRNYEKYRKSDYLEKGYRMINKVLAVSPEFPAALMNKGVILEYSGKNEEAMKCYEKLIKVSPQNVPALINYSLLLMNCKYDFKTAGSFLEKAMLLDPYNYAARYNYAISLYKSGYKVRAILELKRIISAAPGTEMAEYSKALINKINK